MNPARIAACLCLGLAACGGDAPPDRATPAERIAFYTAQIDRHPRLYPAFALLGEAWLERARASHEPEHLRRAEDALGRSLEIQQSYEAFRGMAALAGFRHRFAEALRWAERAAEAMPENPLPVALQVEAWIGLGEPDRAEQVLEAFGGDPDGFYTRLSRARILLERGEHGAAAQLLRAAADRAIAEGAPALAVWALVRASGAWLDNGEPDHAVPLLDAAAAIDAGDRQLAIHRAELASGRGRPGDALALYEALLREGRDPAVHAAAARAAREAGAAGAAERHFTAAESLLRAALAAGEVFPYGDLARLYADAGVRLEDALELARKNLEHARDGNARETAAEIERLSKAR